MNSGLSLLHAHHTWHAPRLSCYSPILIPHTIRTPHHSHPQALLEAESTGLPLVKPLLAAMNLAAPALEGTPTSAAVPTLLQKTAPVAPPPKQQQQAAPSAVPMSLQKTAQAAPSAGWGRRFTDLIDILLGWWLDMAFTDSHRCDAAEGGHLPLLQWMQLARAILGECVTPPNVLPPTFNPVKTTPIASSVFKDNRFLHTGNRPVLE